MANPGPATTTTDHPIGGGSSPSYVGGVGGLIGFYQDPYGLGAVAQPSNSAQNAVIHGQQAGVVATFDSVQTPAAVAQSTTAEQTFTVQSGTGGTFLPATTDVVIVNKPTAQAGLGVGNARITASNTIGITFDNIPAGGNITPTAGQTYSIGLLRGLGSKKLSAALTPAAVPANSSVEQQFTVTGIRPNDLVIVNKPTAQAGLDIGGCRSIGNNTLGITYINATASPITPTAETYSVVSLSGLDAENNSVFFGSNFGTVSAITAGIVASTGVTVNGILATDFLTGMMKPTNGAAATNAAALAGAVLTANTVTPYYIGIGTGATPTASEVYGLHVVRANPVAPLAVFTQTLTPVSVAALTTAEQTFTITGANALVAGSLVWVNKPSLTPGLAITGVRVSAANTLAITYANMTGTAIVPPSESYVIGNFQNPNPGAGNVVYQTVNTYAHQAGSLANAIRTGLAPTTGVNLIAGA